MACRACHVVHCLICCMMMRPSLLVPIPGGGSDLCCRGVLQDNCTCEHSFTWQGHHLCQFMVQERISPLSGQEEPAHRHTPAGLWGGLPVQSSSPDVVWAGFGAGARSARSHWGARAAATASCRSSGAVGSWLRVGLVCVHGEGDGVSR